MAFKFEIGDPKSKKTFHLEAEAEALMGKIIGDKVSGDEIDPKLSGTELEITGTSDKSGFPGYSKIEGTGTRRMLLTRGFGFRKLKLKKKNAVRKPISKGMRKRRTLRGNAITPDVVQINLKVVKQGSKPIAEIFAKAPEAAPTQPAD
jgi:small subunit ribosomal protein S6e